MHANLFNAGNTPDEVYSALRQHLARDSRTVSVLDMMAFGAMIGALIDFHGWHVWLWVIAAVSAASAFRYFVDMSNRNFYMHRIDWEREVAAVNQSRVGDW